MSATEFSDQQIKAQQSLYLHDFEFININYEVKQLNAVGEIKMQSSNNTPDDVCENHSAWSQKVRERSSSDDLYTLQ